MKKFDQHTIRDENPDYKPWTCYVVKVLSAIAQFTLIVLAYLWGKVKKTKKM